MSVERSIRRESDRTRRTKLVRDLLAGGNIAAGSRDLTLVRAAASMASVGLRRDVADQAMRELHSLVEQPRGDIYPLTTAMKKLDVAYRQPWAGAFQRNGDVRSDRPNVQPVGSVEYERPGKATREQLDAPWTALPVPCTIPISPAGDVDRIQRLWNRDIPAIPMPAGTKAGNDQIKPPPWKHLQGGRPTEADWKRWNAPVYARGNTAIIMGHEGDCVCYGVIEFEYAEDFETHPWRDWFLANTLVVRSAKSIHVWLIQKLDRAAGEKPTRGDNDGNAKKQTPVRHEFRGAGNVDTAPGSVHPTGVVYAQINPECKTILAVENVPAFVHAAVPSLFAPAATLQSLDALTPKWEMEIAELFENAPDPKLVQRPQMNGRSMVDLTEEEGADLAEWEEQREPETRRALSKARNDELYGFRRLHKKALAAFPPEHDADLAPIATLPAENIGANSASAALPLLLTNAELFPARETTEALLREVMQGTDNRIRDFHICHWNLKGDCTRHSEHGEQFSSHVTCKAGYDQNCPSLLTMKLRLLRWPDLHGDEQYRTIHLSRWLPYGSLGNGWKAMREAAVQFNHLVTNISHRKLEHTGVSAFMRTTAYAQGRDGFYAIHKFVLLQTDAEKANKTLMGLIEALGANVIGQRLTQRAEAVTLQMMDDSMYSWIGFVPEDELTWEEQVFRFAWYLSAVKRRHMSETLGGLRLLIMDMPKDEKPVCLVCGGKLHFHVDKPQWLEDQERERAPPLAA